MREQRVLVLLNSMSPGVSVATERVLPYLDHFGIPHTPCDLASQPLPAWLDECALILVAHRELDERGARLGAADRQALLRAVAAGAGIVSFDPRLPSAAELGLSLPVARRRHQICGLQFVGEGHPVTAGHVREETVAFSSPLRFERIAADRGEVLMAAGAAPFLAARTLGSGRLVRWATAGWMRPEVLGPLGGLARCPGALPAPRDPPGKDKGRRRCADERATQSSGLALASHRVGRREAPPLPGLRPPGIREAG